jgi:hypothetical protein
VRFQHFQGNPQFFDDYVWATDTVKSAGAQRVGLVINKTGSNKSDRWEYPLWLMLPGRHLVNLVSEVPGHPAPPATSVGAIICEYDTPARSNCDPVVPSGWTVQKHRYLEVALPRG